MVDEFDPPIWMEHIHSLLLNVWIYPMLPPNKYRNLRANGRMEKYFQPYTMNHTHFPEEHQNKRLGTYSFGGDSKVRGNLLSLSIIIQSSWKSLNDFLGRSYWRSTPWISCILQLHLLLRSLSEKCHCFHNDHLTILGFPADCAKMKFHSFQSLSYHSNVEELFPLSPWRCLFGWFVLKISLSHC